MGVLGVLNDRKFINTGRQRQDHKSVPATTTNRKEPLSRGSCTYHRPSVGRTPTLNPRAGRRKPLASGRDLYHLSPHQHAFAPPHQHHMQTCAPCASTAYAASTPHQHRINIAMQPCALCAPTAYATTPHQHHNATVCTECTHRIRRMQPCAPTAYTTACIHRMPTADRHTYPPPPTPPPKPPPKDNGKSHTTPQTDVFGKRGTRISNGPSLTAHDCWRRRVKPWPQEGGQQ